MSRTRSRFIVLTTVAALLFACILVCVSLCAESESGGEAYLEDINMDGQVTVVDAISLLLLGRDKPGDDLADYNADGWYSMTDVVNLLINIMSGNLTRLEEGMHLLIGVVARPGGGGVAGASVRLNGTDSAGQSVYVSISTDSTGRYEFKQIPDGTHSVIFYKRDYVFSPPSLEARLSGGGRAGYRFVLDSVLATAVVKASYEVVAEGFSFPEGPAFDPSGNLYVVNYLRIGDIARITPEGEVSMFLDLNPDGEANGMAIGTDGRRIIACDDLGRRIISIDLESREVTAVVDNYNGQSFNNVNDLALMDNGDIYFTDPYKEDTSIGGRVFVYSQALGKLYLLAENLAFPNGIAVTPDRKTLYVASTVGRCVIAYPLSDEGYAAGEGRQFFLMSSGTGPDGIELDSEGNLYVTHYGAGKVYKVSPQGRILSCIGDFGYNPTNLEIRGDLLYITEAQKKRVVRVGLDQFDQ